jgi:hypothetical protein
VFILLLWEKHQNIITNTYLGAIINETGGSTEGIIHRLSRTRNAFAKLNPLRRLNEYIKRTKIRIYNSNVTAVVLEGAYMWKLYEYDIARLENFHAS